MQVYLQGTPMSTRRNEWSPVVADLANDAVTLALLHRASQLHASSPRGLDAGASKLHSRRHVAQLRRAQGDLLVMMVWVWLSDDSTFRVAWVSESASAPAYRLWNRRPWSHLVFRTEALRRQRRASESA